MEYILILGLNIDINSLPVERAGICGSDEYEFIMTVETSGRVPIEDSFFGIECGPDREWFQFIADKVVTGIPEIGCIFAFIKSNLNMFIFMDGNAVNTVFIGVGIERVCIDGKTFFNACGSEGIDGDVIQLRDIEIGKIG